MEAKVDIISIGMQFNNALCEQIFELKSSCQSFTGIGINLELVKNGNLIEKKTFAPTKQSIIGVIFGILIGLSFVRIIFSLYIQ